MAGIGIINLSKNLVLHFVLFVPNLDCNLLFVSKLTPDLGCITKFSAKSCIFLDSGLGRMIDNAEFCSCLYLLKHDYSPKEKSYSAVCVRPEYYSSSNSLSSSLSNKDSAFMMWHYRLGHPNFIYLEKLLPSLFINKSSKFFQCDICQLSKHTHSSYPSQPYKSSHHFSLIHNDI